MKEQGTVTNLTVRRRRFAAISFTLGVAIAASGVFFSPAEAARGPPVFGAGYDSYLNENQRGIRRRWRRQRRVPVEHSRERPDGVALRPHGQLA